MRVAVVSDIHSNRHALEAVLDEIRALGPDLVLNLGDTVGYNAHPRSCWQLIHREAHVHLLGNHDYAVLPVERRPGLGAFDPREVRPPGLDRATTQRDLTLTELDPEASNDSFTDRSTDLDSQHSKHPQDSQASSDNGTEFDPLLARFNPNARRGLLHARKDLSARDVDAIAALSPRGTLVRGDARLEAFHASPLDPLWEYVLPQHAQNILALHLERADPIPEPRRIVLVGHTHVPCDVRVELPQGVPDAAISSSRLSDPESARRSPGVSPGVRLVNPGSVGQPRDGDPRAAFALLDLASDVVELRRVAYDVESAAADVRAAGLPRALADRLHFGR